MKLGIVISVSNTKFGPIVFKGELLENIEKAKTYGFNGVELAVRDIADLDVDKVLKIVNDYDLEIPVLGTGQIYVDYGLSFSDPDAQRRREAFNKLKKIIDVASAFGSAVIIGCIRGYVRSSPEAFESARKSAEKLVAESIADCLEYTSNKRTFFLLEPLNRYETNLINSVEDTVAFMETYQNILDTERIGILADTFHMNIEDSDITASFKNNIDKIKHIHFADSNRWAPGYGHIDFESIISVLENSTYEGYVSLEMLPFPEPDVSVRNGLEYLRKKGMTILR